VSGREGTLEWLASVLGAALKPLAAELTVDPSRLFARLGIVPPASLFTGGGAGAALAAAASTIKDMVTAVASLDAAIAIDDSAGISLHGTASLTKIHDSITRLAAIGSALDTAIASDPSLSAAQKTRLRMVVADLPNRIFALTVLDALTDNSPTLVAALSLTGILDITLERPDAADPTFAAHVARAIRLDRLAALIKHPLAHFQALLGVGLPTFDGLALFGRLKAILDSRYDHATIVVEAGKPPVLLGPDFVLGVDTSLNPPGLSWPLRFAGTADTTMEFGTGDWTFTLTQKGRYPADCTVRVSANGDIAITPPFGPATLGYAASLAADRKGKPFVLFRALGSSITVEGVALSASFVGAWDAASGRASSQPAFAAELDAGKVVIDTREADGFLTSILAGTRLESTFAVALDFSPASGLRFRGGGSSLDVQIASHVGLGPVAVDALTLSVGVRDDAFPLAVSVDLKTSLGPLTAIVYGIGFEVAIGIVAVEAGNVGPLDIRPGFKAPTGIGLSMDSGGFKGGGVLLFDRANGEYAGALELDFHGLFSVKAIGIINTKMPDGSPGFSLLILITSEFTPIQLSFGFTLNGVGGLFGLNRTIFVNALVEGIRTNAISSILFPQDIVANITRIISDIEQFFPPQEGHFVVGPMAKLGWGTPSIITAELGLLLDLPNPMFAIVGLLKAVLPAEDAPILRLQVNFIGVMDFDRGYIFFRADLFDSRLLIYSITGSMAFLVSWGEEQTFALSVGGFHPDFRDIPTIPALPDGFRNMARIGISLLSDDNPRLKVESYFAVTSNTVQFGARAELYAGVGSFNVYGFLGYDVLFQFDPFRFIAHMYGGIALRDGDDTIAGINISAQLAGPTPWDARGTATLTILLVDIDVDFHVTWGDPPPAIDTKTEDLLALLKSEYADTRNWRADLPPENHLHVSLRTIDPPKDETEPLVIHPAGVVTFSEKALPLENYLIEKFGTRKPLAENQFKLSDANSNGLHIDADFTGVREQFAPAQFSQMSDSDKLSRASFAQLPSGFALTGTSNVQATMPVTRNVDYVLSYLRRKPVHTMVFGIIKLGLQAYNRLVRGSAVRQSVLAQQQKRVSVNAPPPVELPKEKFVVATVTDLKAYGAAKQSFATEAEAYQYQQSLLRADPALAGQIQVVSHFELAR
jgi:hypothetical protein